MDSGLPGLLGLSVLVTVSGADNPDIDTVIPLHHPMVASSVREAYQ